MYPFQVMRIKYLTLFTLQIKQMLSSVGLIQFVYINSAFSPSPDETVSDLFEVYIYIFTSSDIILIIKSKEQA